jgi:hypothetical protein
MSNNLTNSDISRELEALKMTTAKIANTNNQINDSVKSIRFATQNAQKVSFIHLSKLNERVTKASAKIDKAVKVSINKSTKISHVITNIKNIINNNITVNYNKAANDINKTGEGEPAAEPSHDLEKCNQFVLKLNSLIDKLSLLTINFNFQPSLNINNSLSASINLLSEKVTLFAATINVTMSLMTLSVNVLITKIDVMISTIILQSTLMIGYFNQLMAIFSAGQSGTSSGSESKEKTSWWRDILDVLGDYGTIKEWLMKFFPNATWLQTLLDMAEKAVVFLFTALLNVIVIGIKWLFRSFIVPILEGIVALVGLPAFIIGAIVTAVGYLIYTFRDEILAGLDYLSEVLINAFKSLWDVTSDVLKMFTVDAYNSIKEAFSSIGEFISNWWTGKPSEKVVKASESALNWGKAFIDNSKANNLHFFTPNQIPMMEVTPDAIMSASDIAYTFNSMPNIVVNAQGLNDATLQLIKETISSGVQNGEKELTRTITGGMS